jgi:multiple sugar transport system ATP-binding protein
MNLIKGAEAEARGAPTIGIRPEHFDVSTTEGAWEGTIGVAEHLGSDTFLHIHGVAGCDPMTVRVDGELSVKHGDRIFLTPQADKLHRFDAQGLRVE